MTARKDRTAIYCRVSTDDQDAGMQLDELRRLAKFKKWNLTAEFVDHGQSGKKTTRPQLDKLMRDVRAGKVTRVAVWKLDRFGRNAAHLVTSLDEFRELGVKFTSMTEGFDTGTAQGRAMMQIMGALAELERENIAERTRAGLARAKREGKRLGRPKACTPGEVARMTDGGMGLRAISRELGVGVATVSRRLAEARERGLLAAG